MGIHKEWEIASSVVYNSSRCEGWRKRQCGDRRSASCRIESGGKKDLLERRITARKSEQLAEHPVVEDAVARADRRLAPFKGIPRESDARLEVMPVVVVKRRQPLVFLSGNHESERSRLTRIREEGRKQIVHFIGNTVELIAQAIAQGEVWKNLVGVLHEGAELGLAEAAGIIGRVLAALVKKLCLSLRADRAEQRPDHVLQRGIRVNRRYASLKSRYAKIGEIVEVNGSP